MNEVEHNLVCHCNQLGKRTGNTKADVRNRVTNEKCFDVSHDMKPDEHHEREAEPREKSVSSIVTTDEIYK